MSCLCLIKCKLLNLLVLIKGLFSYRLQVNKLIFFNYVFIKSENVDTPRESICTDFFFRFVLSEERLIYKLLCTKIYVETLPHHENISYGMLGQS